MELYSTGKTGRSGFRLRTAPGMGPVCLVFGCLFSPEISSWSPVKSLPALALPRTATRPGSSVRKPTRSNGFSNSDRRRVFHQAARSVTTHKPHYRDYYERKLAEGKHELLVINNIINKLIDLYCAIWNNQADYDPTISKK